MKTKRVVVYLPDKDHRTVQTILDLEGVSLSQWVRRAVTSKIARARTRTKGTRT